MIFIHFLRSALVVCFFIAALPLFVSAQSVADIDSVHVYHFDSKTFSSYSADIESDLPAGIIGESKLGTLSRIYVNDFDFLVEPDTSILYRVADFFDPLDYPFSASVKLFRQIDDELVQRCSGVMISDYWVTTANHCFNFRSTYRNNWPADSISTIFVSPSFHNGAENPVIGTIEVDKAMFVLGGFFPDFVFLRLMQPAGRKTGSVGMRTSALEDIEESDISLTFGYPAVYLNHRLNPSEFDNIYNGDTLFVSQNVVLDRAVFNDGPSRFRFGGHSNPGQSGSPVLFYRHGDWYTYGVLSAFGFGTLFFTTLVSTVDPSLSQIIQELMLKYHPEEDTEEPYLAENVYLYNNYPNPFSATTRIEYEIPAEMSVSIDVFDVLGRKLGTLVDRVQSEGKHSVYFDGSTIPSGVYIYRLQAGSEVHTRKMTLIK
ncbi:MAG: T9SS type A sorting domain-containing protein [Balneolales bacterium]|nr:T9SS type A sorting domain-containing protein [Balneolales bacterium]